MTDEAKARTAKARRITSPWRTNAVGDSPDGASSEGRTARTEATAEPYLTWLGQSLRSSYEETLREPVPDQFHTLLDRLEQQDEDPSPV